MGLENVEIREALRQAIDEEMALNSRIFLIGEEVGKYNGAYKVSKGLLAKYGPKRIWDSPISENGFAGLAIGAAATGLRPIVEFMSWNFSFVAADQLISNAPKYYYMSGGRFKVPVVFRGCNGSAAQISCQHSHCVESIYGTLPGWTIISPGNAYDAKGLLKASLRCNNPVMFLENELDYGDRMDIPVDEYTVPIGKAKIVQEGSGATLISYSHMLKHCMAAAAEMAKKGVGIEIIDLRTIKPLDIELIAASVQKTHRCVLVEEGHSFAGISAEIGFQIMEHCFDFLDAPIERVCQRETPMPYSKVLERETLPNPERIIAALERALL